MEFIYWDNLKVSRLILGGNPFSGFSHQGLAADQEMRSFFTTDQIKETLRNAESQSVNTLVARADQHIIRVLLEYYDEGGTIQLLAQTCPEYITIDYSINKASACRAKGCHIHGGVMDYLFSQGRLEEVIPVIDHIHAKGMMAGIAGHNPDVFSWAEENQLPVDYYMCAYYNPDRRDNHAEHRHGVEEQYLIQDRQRMVKTIKTLNKPVIHYKILAAGRNDPKKAFSYTAKQMRSDDAVCVGIFQKHNPSMLKEDIAYLSAALSWQNPINSREVLLSQP